jgi:hypothetical protein
MITAALGSAKAILAASSITAYQKLEKMSFVPSHKTMPAFAAYCGRRKFLLNRSDTGLSEEIMPASFATLVNLKNKGVSSKQRFGRTPA